MPTHFSLTFQEHNGPLAIQNKVQGAEKILLRLDSLNLKRDIRVVDDVVNHSDLTNPKSPLDDLEVFSGQWRRTETTMYATQLLSQIKRGSKQLHGLRYRSPLDSHVVGFVKDRRQEQLSPFL